MADLNRRVLQAVQGQGADQEVLQFLGDMFAVKFPAQGEVFEPEDENAQCAVGLQKFLEFEKGPGWLLAKRFPGRGHDLFLACFDVA